MTAGDATVTVLDSNGEATAVRIHVSDDGILGLSDLELSEMDDVIEMESPEQQEIVMGSDLDVTIE